MSARANLAEQLEAGTTSKTLVLEVHSDNTDATLASLFGDAVVHRTADDYLHKAQLGDGSVWVDQLDERFWSVHTDMPLAPVRRLLHAQVQSSRQLDWMWLPNQHLDRVRRHSPARRIRTTFSGSALRGSGAPGSGLNLSASGEDAGTILRLLGQSEEFSDAVSLDSVEVALDDGMGGTTREAVDRKGAFLADGPGFDAHVQFVRSVVQRYAAFVTLLERKALGWEPFSDGGGRVLGAPVGIHFTRTIPDVIHFAENLVDSREPFRLWGAPAMQDGVAEVEAVDLHVGQRLGMDIGPDWMCVYLERGACGNTVARLISNLQHCFDSGLSLSDPQLQAALDATDA